MTTEQYPVTGQPQAEKERKKPSAFARVMRAIFVHNIGYKLLALALSVALWALAVGLGA